MSQVQSPTKRDIDAVRTQFESLTQDQALARITGQPLEMVEEAKVALQSIKQLAQDHDLSPDQVITIVEPLARAVGWAEGLAFAFDKTSYRDAVQSMVGNGYKSPGRQ